MEASPKKEVAPLRESPVEENRKPSTEIENSHTLASQYLQQGNNAAAIAEYQKIIRREPQNVKAHFYLGFLYMQNHQHRKEAIHHLKKVLEFQPEHSKKKIIETWIQDLKK
jgi:Tfp pilus assembly protein PilF